MKSDLTPSAVDYADRADRLIEKIQSFPEGKELYSTSIFIVTLFNYKPCPWKIQFEESSTSPASSLPGKRTIRLNPSSSEMENLSDLLFELINISQMPSFKKLEMLAAQGKIKREEFAKEIERVEFRSAQTHHSIVSKAIKQLNWDLSTDYFPNHGSDADFESFWEKTWKHSDHAERYRKLWDLFQMEWEDAPTSPSKISESEKTSPKQPTVKPESLAVLVSNEIDISPVTPDERPIFIETLTLENQISMDVSPKTPDSIESTSSRFTIIDMDESEEDFP